MQQKKKECSILYLPVTYLYINLEIKRHKTLIITAALYGCETSSLNLNIQTWNIFMIL
jgi:hypothetical protein